MPRGRRLAVLAGRGDAGDDALVAALAAADPLVLARRGGWWPRSRAASALVVCGWQPWTGALPPILARRPRLPVTAVLATPVALDWPEYAAPAVVAALPRALDALRRHAAIVIVPDAASASRLAEVLPGVPLRVEPRPSLLAGPSRGVADPGLAARPYMVACGPIEARANTLLLLHLWRDGLARGKPLPRLVLAGARGEAIEDIAPMLDWGTALRPHVVEAPGLAGDALRALLAGARALLAPAFADPEAALLRDARACGIPVLAADIPAYREALGDGLLSPIDGPGWRSALLAVAAQPPVPVEAVLPDWPAYAARLIRHAEAA